MIAVTSPISTLTVPAEPQHHALVRSSRRIAYIKHWEKLVSKATGICEAPLDCFFRHPSRIHPASILVRHILNPHPKLHLTNRQPDLHR